MRSTNAQIPMTNNAEARGALGHCALVIRRASRLGHLCLLVVILMTTGCEDDMADQPRYEPLEPGTFFDDGLSSRQIPDGTVARGHLRSDTHLYEGKVNGQLASDFPFPITKEWLARGRERYEIYCAVCHGSTGDGYGMIVQRGFVRPPAFYPVSEHQTALPRLYEREQWLMTTATVGHYFDVITNGWGAMFSYNDRVKPEDRWAIIMYIKALQRSQYVRADRLPPDVRAKLDAPPATAPASTQEAHR
jgi:mono/diheme cytochrome c family protein